MLELEIRVNCGRFRDDRCCGTKDFDPHFRAGQPASDRSDGPTSGSGQRLIRCYFFACALNAVLAAFAENPNVTLGRTDLEMGIRGVAMLVLT